MTMTVLDRPSASLLIPRGLLRGDGRERGQMYLPRMAHETGLLPVQVMDDFKLGL